MIKVTIELHSAVHPSRSRKLGEVYIVNQGERTILTGGKEADYNVTFKNRRGAAFKHKNIKRWRRNDKSIWKLMKEVFDAFE